MKRPQNDIRSNNEEKDPNVSISERLLFRVTILISLILVPGAQAANLPLTDETIDDAVTKWVSYSGRDALEAKYGHIRDWNTSQVTEMSYLFTHARFFSEDLSHWDVSSVTDMKWMFAFANTMHTDLSEWDVSKVEDMSWMFFEASRFDGYISNWDTGSVTNMAWMFGFATEFTSDIGDWDTSKVTNMNGMFAGATKFNSKVSPWDTSKLTSANAMFLDAENFKEQVCWPRLRDDFLAVEAFCGSGETAGFHPACVDDELLVEHTECCDSSDNDTATNAFLKNHGEGTYEPECLSIFINIDGRNELEHRVFITTMVFFAVSFPLALLAILLFFLQSRRAWKRKVDRIYAAQLAAADMEANGSVIAIHVGPAASGSQLTPIEQQQQRNSTHCAGSEQSPAVHPIAVVPAVPATAPAPTEAELVTISLSPKNSDQPATQKDPPPEPIVVDSTFLATVSSREGRRPRDSRPVYVDSSFLATGP